MFRIFRDIDRGEFFLVAGDCSQGGNDQNYCQFLSATKLDFPLVYSAHGVAAEMTSVVHPALEWLYDQTQVQPELALERSMGGASEMERFKVLNRNGKYRLYTMKKEGTTEDSKDTNKLGWDTTTASRPPLVSDWKQAFDGKLVTIYDEQTIKQHKTFIVNKQGKPEATKGKHDDAVISCAIAWQMYQTVPLRGIQYNQESPSYQPSDDVIGI